MHANMCLSYVEQIRMKLLRIAYNNAYRIMHYIPRYVRVRPHQVNHDVTTHDALFINYAYHFVRRCESL